MRVDITVWARERERALRCSSAVLDCRTGTPGERRLPLELVTRTRMAGTCGAYTRPGVSPAPTHTHTRTNFP